MILVTGANGTVGRAVANALGKLDVPFRRLVRSNPKQGEIAGDFADMASMKAALTGIETVFLVCSPIPELVALESNVIDACVESGVRHLVLTSAMGAGEYPKSFPAWHTQVEEKLKGSGLAYTILRPNGFMQNISAYYAPSIRAQSVFYASMQNGKASFLDVRDIGAAAANILAAPQEHAGKIYELNGPEAVTYAELAARISQVAGRTVRYIDLPEEAQRGAMLGMGIPSWRVEALLELQQYYVAGAGGEVTDVLESLLGRAPVKLDDFLAEFKDSFEAINPKTGFTLSEAKHFVRNHFEEFVNRKNLDIGDVNFAPEFVDNGADVPKGMPPGPAGAKAYVGGAYKKFPDIHVDILDLIAEDDRVVVRNHWTGTEAATGKKYEFSGIVIWRIAHKQLVERWAYLTPPTEVH